MTAEGTRRYTEQRGKRRKTGREPFLRSGRLQVFWARAELGNRRLMVCVWCAAAFHDARVAVPLLPSVFSRFLPLRSGRKRAKEERCYVRGAHLRANGIGFKTRTVYIHILTHGSVQIAARLQPPTVPLAPSLIPSKMSLNRTEQEGGA